MFEVSREFRRAVHHSERMPEILEELLGEEAVGDRSGRHSKGGALIVNRWMEDPSHVRLRKPRTALGRELLIRLDQRVRPLLEEREPSLDYRRPRRWFTRFNIASAPIPGMSISRAVGSGMNVSFNVAMLPV